VWVPQGRFSMSSNPSHHASPSLEAFQSLLKEIDEVNCRRPAVPTVNELLQYTHSLSHRLSSLLNHLLRISAGGETDLREKLPPAIDDVTDSITTLKELMVSIHRIRLAEREKYSQPY